MGLIDLCIILLLLLIAGSDDLNSLVSAYMLNSLLVHYSGYNYLDIPLIILHFKVRRIHPGLTKLIIKD